MLVKAIGSFAIVMLLTAALVGAFSVFMQDAQVFRKVTIGMVIPEEEGISRLAAQYISSMDSVRSVCDFVYLDEKEAVKELKEGNLQAVVVLPEGFYHDVQKGINPPAQIYFPEESGQNTLVFEQLVESGVSFLQTAEAGVYAGLDTASYYGINLQGANLGDTIAWLFANQMLKRDKIYSDQVFSPLGNLTVPEYYYAAGLVILLMMCGIQFGFLYGKRRSSVEDKLRIHGVGEIRQLVTKVTVMSMFLYAMGMIYYLAGIEIADLTGIDLVYDRSAFWGKLLLLCVEIALYFHILYELAGSSAQAGVFVFAVNVITIVGAGILIPEAYLGRTVTVIARFLPMRYWNAYVAGIMKGIISSETFNEMICFLLIGLIAGVLLSWIKRGIGIFPIVFPVRKRPRPRKIPAKTGMKIPEGLVYYEIQLKLWMRKRICWLQILFLALLLFLVGSIHLPDEKNSKIGLAGVNGTITQSITEQLVQKKGVYQFVEYEDTEQLKEAVRSGELECGFVFADHFDELYEKGAMEDSIAYVHTPFTTKGLAVKETVYGAFLKQYGEKLLQQNQETITGQSSEEVSMMLTERYRYYLNSDSIFHTEVHYEATNTTESADNHWNAANVFGGVIAGVTFLAIYLAGASFLEERNRKVLSQLERGKRHRFECAGILASATPILLIGSSLSVWNTMQTGIGAAMGSVTGFVFTGEIFRMLLLVGASLLFTAAAMCIFRSSTGMLSALPVFLLMQIIVCPVFVDVSFYVPAVKYIRYLCPIGYYQ